MKPMLEAEQYLNEAYVGRRTLETCVGRRRVSHHHRHHHHHHHHHHRCYTIILVIKHVLSDGAREEISK